MRAQSSPVLAGEAIFAGIDMHKRQWHVTVRTADAELFSASIPGTWDALRSVLGRYHRHPITAAYEAGCFGFWLHDCLVAHGAQCLVTPQSLLPQESRTASRLIAATAVSWLSSSRRASSSGSGRRPNVSVRSGSREAPPAVDRRPRADAEPDQG